MRSRAARLVAVAVTWGALAVAAPHGLAHEEGEPPAPPPPGELPSESTGRVPCGEDGHVHAGSFEFACSGVDLLAWESFGGIPSFANDIWGWTDPLDGGEYVVIGRFASTEFVDVSDPEHPVWLGTLPTAAGENFWGAVKVYGNHAYIVKDFAGAHGLQVFDLTQLRDVENPPVTFAATNHYTGFGNSHNVAVNEETGFLYAVGSTTDIPGFTPCDGGLHMLDLADPASPAFVGCYAQDGYVHDTQCVVYRGPDTEHQGKEICLNSNAYAGTISIVDVTDKAAPVRLANETYDGAVFAHQGWLTEDQAFFLVDDELDERDFGHGSRTYVWDVRDLDAPFLVGDYTSDLLSTDHNLFIRGDRVFEANYSSGLRVLRHGDLDQLELEEIAFFDTYPVHDEVGTNFGPWSVYPFFESGIVVVSDILLGLFVLQPTPVPEPSLAWLQLGALVLAAGVARRARASREREERGPDDGVEKRRLDAEEDAPGEGEAVREA